MPDVPMGLPPRTPSCDFAAAPDGFVASRRQGVRRRRRQALVGGGGLLSVGAVVLAVLVSPSGDGQQVLTPAGRLPGLSATPHASPTITLGPSPQVTSLAAPAAVATPSPTLFPLLPRSSARPRPSSTTTAPRGQAITNGPEPTRTSYDPTRQCSGSGPSAANGYCSYYDGDRSAARGSKAVLATSVCRLPGQGTGTLTTGSGRYAEFTVSTNATGSLWDYSHGRRFGTQSRDFIVAESTCLRFAVIWGLNSDDGRPLAQGMYDLTAFPDVANRGVYAGIVAVETFTIT